ncbi:hypothetical protein N9893_01000 [bacterium]|nr:hypothetical protein [bacterium]
MHIAIDRQQIRYESNPSTKQSHGRLQFLTLRAILAKDIGPLVLRELGISHHPSAPSELLVRFAYVLSFFNKKYFPDSIMFCFKTLQNFMRMPFNSLELGFWDIFLVHLYTGMIYA